MSSTFPSDEESKLSWIYRGIKELGLPIAILVVVTWWLAVRVETRFTKLEEDIKLHQKYLQQIYINTAPDSERRYQCWNIQ